MTVQNAAGRCDPVRGAVLAVLFSSPLGRAPHDDGILAVPRSPYRRRSIRSGLGAGPLPRPHGCPAVRAGRSTTGPREPARAGRTSHSN